MVLADTSVWINHLRNSNSTLIKLLEEVKVYSHPFIKGELACGNIKNRSEFFKFYNKLPVLSLVTENEALFFLNEHKLFGKGLGWIDVHLLASVYLNNIKLFTIDRKLKQTALKLGVCFQ